LNIVRLATTKGQTELAGSHTFYFDKEEIFAYNNLYGIKAKNTYPITGSVNADKFYQLIKRVQDEKVSGDDEKIVIKYGKNKATLRKEQDALKMYKSMVFNNKYEKQEMPEDFVDMLSLIKYQNHNGAISGLFVDEDIAYIVNQNDLASFKLKNSFNQPFWIPREGADLLLGLQVKFTHYALNNAFLYVFGEDITIAVKLKMVSGFPLNAVEKLLENKKDFRQYVIIDNLTETLNRIKISTIQDANQKTIFSMDMGETEVVVESMGGDKIEEHLEYTNHEVDPIKVIAPIDTFQMLYNKADKIYVLVGVDDVFLAHHTDTVTYIMRVEEA